MPTERKKWFWLNFQFVKKSNKDSTLIQQIIQKTTAIAYQYIGQEKDCNWLPQNYLETNHDLGM